MKKYRKSQWAWAAIRAKKITEQSGLCACCGCKLGIPSSKKGGAQLDHHHATGAIRGVLCKACNTGIGLFDEDPTKLLKAYQYLRRWRAS